MIYNIYDSEGHLVRGGFHTFNKASEWKSIFGNYNHRIKCVNY